MSELKWLPLEITPQELELMAMMEAERLQILIAFRLSLEEIGYTQDCNRTYSESQAAAYKRRFAKVDNS
jgi:hypothetical protein